MTTPFTGGCACGAIRYECTAAPDDVQMFRCHCRDCQRLTGGPYASVVFVPAETLKITRGALSRFGLPSEAGGTHTRGFCPDCGSRLTGGEVPGSPGIGVMASSLDDPSWFKPALDIWMADRQPWDAPDPATKHFDTYPPES